MRLIKALGLMIILVITLAVGFAAGLIVDRQALLPVTGLINPMGDAQAATPPDKLDTGLIEDANNIIQKHYADRKTLESTNMTYGAISGMVDALGDTGHSRFMSPQVVAEEARQIQGEYEGIGALLNVNQEGNPVILAPMDGSPAQKAGLKPGDIILEVDGHDVSTASLDQVISRVLGPAGTNVTLTIRRENESEVRKVTITRAKIVVKNVTWQMLPGTDIAHVRIAGYSNNVTRDLVNALNEAKSQGAKGVILDLRNNPGGLLQEAVGVVSQFLSPPADVMQTKDAQGNVDTTPTKRGGVATDIPMVVLINKGSASAAEITAGAMQDYNRATLVGETTFGTGTVLNQFRLRDGSAMLLATELWLTPKGRVIWHQGIAPDVEVPLPTDVNPSFPESERDLTAQGLQDLKDLQLKKALELMQQKIK